MPGEWNFPLYQGETFDYTLTWKDENGDPVDNTGYTARMQLRASPDATSIDLDLTTENGGIILGGTDGTIRLLADATDTEAVETADGTHDLEMDNAGYVTRLTQGKWWLDKETTK